MSIGGTGAGLFDGMLWSGEGLMVDGRVEFVLSQGGAQLGGQF